MRTLQTIRQNKVSNFYTMGNRIQKWAKANASMVPTSLNAPIDGYGSRILTEALIKWSNGYLRPYVVLNDQNEPVFSLAGFSLNDGDKLYLDAYGLASNSNIYERFRVQKNMDVRNIIPMSENCSLPDYSDSEPDLINNMAEQLKIDLKEFKPAMLIKSMTNVELMKQAASSNIKVYDLDNVLEKRQYSKIPRTSNIEDVMSFIFEPVKNIDKVDHFEILAVLSKRDKWEITADDYIKFIKAYQIKVNYNSYGVQKDERLLSHLKDWDPKVSKYIYKCYRDDIYKFTYKNMALDFINLHLSDKNGNFISSSEDDGLITVKDKTGKIYTSNKKLVTFDNVYDVLTNDLILEQKLNEDTKEIEEVTRMSQLFDMYSEVEHILHEKLNFVVRQHPELKETVTDAILKHSKFNFSEQNLKLSNFLTLLENLDSTKLNETQVFKIMQATSRLNLDSQNIALQTSFWTPELITDYLDKLVNAQPELLYLNSYKYPILINNMSEASKVKMVEARINSQYRFNTVDDPELEHLSNDEKEMYLIELYFKDFEPQVKNIVSSAKAIAPDDAFKTFIQMYKAKKENITELELPTL